MAKCDNCGIEVPAGFAACPRCGEGEADPSTVLRDAASRPVPAASTGRLGRFELISEIGRGGMGVVYKAWDPLLSRIVALKRMNDPPAAVSAADETAERRFLREARTTSRLSHPNVVRVYEVGSEGGAHFFTMDFVEGQSFARMLHPEQAGPSAAAVTSATRREALSLRRGIEVLRDVARGVAHAHAQGVLHRDLKPANVLVNSEGKAFVTDFGLARDISFADASILTMSGDLLGTPQYMSPEQATGRGKEATAASDVFSMGVMLYEVLTGRPPFQAQTLPDLLAAIARTDPVPPRSISKEVSQDAEVVCLKCLEKAPSRRYASMEALAEDLDALLLAQPIQARPVSLWRRMARVARRHVGVFWAAAGLAVLALVIAGLVSEVRDIRRRKMEDLCQKAQNLVLLDSRSQEAMTLLDQAIGLGYGSAKPYELRAQLHAWRGEYQPALDDLGSALSLDPRSPYYRVLESQMYLALGDDEAAIGTATEAIRLDASSALAWATRAQARFHKGDLDAALSDAEEALKRDAASGPAHLVKGEALCSDLQYADGIVEFNQALADPSIEAEARYQRGIALYATGEYAKAADDLERFLVLRPHHAQADFARNLAKEARKHAR